MIKMGFNENLSRNEVEQGRKPLRVSYQAKSQKVTLAPTCGGALETIEDTPQSLPDQEQRGRSIYIPPLHLTFFGFAPGAPGRKYFPDTYSLLCTNRLKTMNKSSLKM